MAANDALAKLNRVCKWRSILTGWQLGTRPMGDPEAQAIRDQRDLLIALRCEVSALVALLVKADVFSLPAWEAQLGDEADALDAGFRERFPGIEATDYGIAIVDPAKAAETMRGWKP
jgi:hypothetical protein